jgi:hypothetical protein
MQTVDTEFLKDRCALTLTLRAWGNKRQGNIDKVSTDADKTRLGLMKKLVVSEEYDAVVSYLNEIRAYVLSRTMPFTAFKTGVYLAKLATVKEIEADLPERIRELGNKVDALCAKFPEQKEAARLALNGQFKDSDYPSVDKLRTLFGVEWNWIAFSVPENLPAEIREAEAKKLQTKFQDAGEEILQALRAGFQELVSHAVERLTVAPGEKPKTFRDSLVGNVQEFIDTFNARNLMNDSQLEALVTQARSVIAGIDPQDLREKADLRERTKAAFAEVKSRVDAMITERPARKFNFGED